MTTDQIELLMNIISIAITLIPICAVVVAYIKNGANMNAKINENERRIDKLERKVDSMSEDIISIKEESAKQTTMLQFIIDSIKDRK